MSVRVNRIWLAMALCAMASLSFAPRAARSADESSIALAPGPAAAEVRAYCSVCHSADYIVANGTFLDRAGWEKEVRKMIKVMGAPIPEDQVGTILDYLANNYGKH